ncbi:MAG: PAS domain-containing sensor histidine kinase [Ruminococcaceae bacterium]|nr:PAS domain-containing sensor histidine kinase [Oscillospiraceae bacterium]
MTKRIFRAICIVAISTFLAALVLITGVLYDYFSEMHLSQLGTQAELTVQGVMLDGLSYFEGLETSEFRITWVAHDGTVIYDSVSNPENMENHLDREEIQKAIQTGYGESSRYSTTMMEEQLYVAQKLNNGSVIRVSDSQYTPLTLILSMLHQIIIAVIIAVAVSLVIAFHLSKSIVKPLNTINLDKPADNQAYEELSPLLERISSQQQQLKLQATELQQKKDEFETTTSNMTEGLVWLNEEGIILSINNSAARVFGTDNSCIGKNLLLLNNSTEMHELLCRAREGEHTEMVIPLDSSNYQFIASPVTSGSSISGISILILNITEKAKAEQLRREFTANVSHELKTPLHTISGYAELLSNGMVKEQDVPKFSSQIYSETKRLISLIEDIIKLSHLDEGGNDMQREDVDLYTLAEYTVKSLSASAEVAGVAINLGGSSAPMHGIPQLLGGIIYNLCDNAIKYNRENGTVDVSVQPLQDTIVLTVSDSGIGIPYEDQERIFERFYRVDKSHSKEMGGTGLGLSIVKHSAKLHNAQIQLESVLNKGTTVTVTFPK